MCTYVMLERDIYIFIYRICHDSCLCFFCGELSVDGGDAVVLLLTCFWSRRCLRASPFCLNMPYQILNLWNYSSNTHSILTVFTLTWNWFLFYLFYVCPCLPPAPRIKPYLSLHAEAEAPDDLAVEEDEEAMPTETGKAIELENNLMMEALWDAVSLTEGHRACLIMYSLYSVYQFLWLFRIAYWHCIYFYF